jgi:Domain of unknown function (DUF6456)
MARHRRLRAARRNKERRKRYAEAREAALELGEEQPKRLLLARSRTMLEQLLAGGSISPEQMRAGDRLATDYRVSQSTPTQLTIRYEPGPRPLKRHQQPADSLAAIAARERFEAALAAVMAVEPELAGILMHAVVCDEPPGTWGQLNGHPVTDGILKLRDGLDILVDYYGARRRVAA